MGCNLLTIKCRLIGPYIFVDETKTKVKVEAINIQTAGNFELETRAETDGKSATVKARMKKVNVRGISLDLSGTVTKDEDGTKTKLEAKTSTSPFSIGGMLEVLRKKDGSFDNGRVGILFQAKTETANKTVIKSTTTIGKTF